MIAVRASGYHTENEIFQMYKFDTEHPGQSVYTPTTVGVIMISETI